MKKHYFGIHVRMKSRSGGIFCFSNLCILEGDNSDKRNTFVLSPVKEQFVRLHAVAKQLLLMLDLSNEK